MPQSKLTCTAVILAFVATAAAAQNANHVRSAFSNVSKTNVCGGSPSVAKWCAELGVQSAYWIEKGVSLAVDGQFDQKDQALANRIGIAICYNDDRCIHPR